MMENEDQNLRKQKKGLKIAGILSAFVIAILAIIRFITKSIDDPNLKGLNQIRSHFLLKLLKSL